MDTNASESLLSLDHQDDYNAYEESGEEQVSGLQLQDRQGLPAHQIASASGVNNQPCLTDLYEVLFKLLIGGSSALLSLPMLALPLLIPPAVVEVFKCRAVSS